MAQTTEMTRARQKSLPWQLIGMSFSEVFLGGLLSSRARLRFPRYARSATIGCRSSRKSQRTATVELHNCLKKGRSPKTGVTPESETRKITTLDSNGNACLPKHFLIFRCPQKLAQ
jgi:hypothetical protein